MARVPRRNETICNSTRSAASGQCQSGRLNQAGYDRDRHLRREEILSSCRIERCKRSRTSCKGIGSFFLLVAPLLSCCPLFSGRNCKEMVCGEEHKKTKKSPRNRSEPPAQLHHSLSPTFSTRLGDSSLTDPTRPRRLSPVTTFRAFSRHPSINVERGRALCCVQKPQRDVPQKRYRFRIGLSIGEGTLKSTTSTHLFAITGSLLP